MAEIIQTKRCSKCNIKKPFFAFHKNKAQPDGLQNWCILCRQILDKTSKRIAFNKIRGSKYRQTKTAQIKAKLRTRKYRQTEKGKQKDYQYHKARLQSNPEQHKASAAIQRAIKHNKIKPAKCCACYYCNKQAQHYHHPRGYDKAHWLDVVPLCSSCHKNTHVAITPLMI